VKILHVLRAPVGGLFRHVLDLAAGQIERGHEVGIVADSTEAPPIAEAKLAALKPSLPLGLHRIPIGRRPGPTDLPATMQVSRILRATRAEIVHGHGAKGGALARLAGAPAGVVRVYTPHGGSLHSSVGGRLGIILERLLMRRGQIYLFESAYSRDIYLEKVGKPSGPVRVIHNGLRDEDFQSIGPAPDAADVVYLGEMRTLKGVDVLLEALAKLSCDGHTISAALVGEGPDAAQFRNLADRLGLRDLVSFHESMPARQAFALGRVLVIPSRAESLPYVVLEAAAAGKPLVATNVGGIPEIFGPFSDSLVAPEDADALAMAILKVGTTTSSEALRKRVRENFSVDAMVEAVLDAYGELRPSLNDAASRGSKLRQTQAGFAPRNAA